MQFQCGFARARIITPWKQIQGQRDDGGVQSENHFGEIGIQRGTLIETGGSAHQDFRHALVQSPIPMFISVSQISAGNVAAKAEVIEQWFSGIQTGDDIAQTFPISELAKTQSQELIIMRKTSGRFSGWERCCEPGKFRRIEARNYLGKKCRVSLHPGRVMMPEGEIRFEKRKINFWISSRT